VFDLDTAGISMVSALVGRSGEETTAAEAAGEHDQEGKDAEDHDADNDDDNDGVGSRRGQSDAGGVVRIAVVRATGRALPVSVLPDVGRRNIGVGGILNGCLHGCARG